MAPTGETNAFNKVKTIPLEDIPDLDTGSCSKVAVKAVNRSLSFNFAAVLRQAKCVSQGRENEDGLEAKITSEEEEDDDDDGIQFLLYDDINCLCGVDILNKVPVPFSSSNYDLTGGLSKSPLKPWKSSGKGKKRKKTKSVYQKKLHKRQKVNRSISTEYMQPPNQINHKLMKTAGGGSHKTSTKTGYVSAQPSPASVANGGMCCLNVHGKRGGGGGGGDDGDGRPPKKPPEVMNCGSSRKQKPKKKKRGTNNDVNQSVSDSSAEDEQSEVNTTTTKNMAVDEQSDPSKEISDVEMVSQDVQQNNVHQMQPSQPCPPQTEEFVASQQLIMVVNGRINHNTFCKNLKGSCDQCQKVNAIMHHFFDETHGTCKCRYCQLWSCVLNYHTPICKYKSDCKVCKKYASQVAQGTTAAPEPSVAAEEENFPTCSASLDENESVVWKSPDVSGLTHFKEDRHYLFEQDSYWRKGGHGTIRKVAIPDNVKKKYFSSFCHEFVMKEAGELDDDELSVLSEAWRHPNFVKTFLVVKKKNVEKPYRILMEKCEMSLKEYLNRLLNQGKRMRIDEAMFYWIQVFEAVKHLHFMKIGVIHKDIKAGNVLLTVAENLVRVKLADFDTVRRLHNEYTCPGLSTKGTLGLISPEVLRQESHGRPADVWNMAMFLIELLFAVEFSEFQKKVQPSKKEVLLMFLPRHDTELKKFLAETIPKLKKIDQDLGDLIERCLSEEASERPTAVEVLEDPAVVKYVNQTIDMGQLIVNICPHRKQ